VKAEPLAAAVFGDRLHIGNRQRAAFFFFAVDRQS
jgi:hypothetical protein